MQVTPSRTKLSQDLSVFRDLLKTCQAQCRERNISRIVSISVGIPAVDPLAVLEQWQCEDPFFYWEQPAQELAIAAITPEVCLEAEQNRFTKTQDFIDSALENAIIRGNLARSFSGPHFFCGFTFFEDSSTDNRPFPSGLTFLPRWQIVRHRQQSTLVANFAIAPQSPVEEIVKIWQDRLEALNNEVFQVQSRHRGLTFLDPPHSQTESIQASIGQAVQLISENKLQKLVLAHPLDITTTQPLPVGDTLNRLRRHYPECYIFAIGNGAGKTFWGASPERLVGLRDGQLSSDVLAGSAPRGETVLEDLSLGKKLLNNRKDGHEHQLVLDFIRNQLKALGIEPQNSSPTQLMQLANIQHLHTLVSASTPPQLKLLEILAALHPTPAVAGTPRDLACHYIRQFETFDRHLYAAPIGWINHAGHGEFAVGIRSALSDGCQTRIYGGAGIVSGSEPSKELAEVELKLQTLIEALI